MQINSNYEIPSSESESNRKAHASSQIKNSKQIET